MKVDLSWPNPLLWPNGSAGSRRAVAGAKKKARSDAGWSAIQARQAQGQFQHDGAEIPVKLIVYPKPRGPLPDKDNCIAAVKVMLDAIAEQIGVNDRHFAAPIVEFAKPRVGKMEIEIG